MTKGLDIKYKNILDAWGINTPLRLSHFFAQIYTESGLVAKRESLYYKSIQSLRLNFKSPFRGKTNEFIKQYLRNSEKCANYVYANRGGNGDESSQDGYIYRGGGYLQHTGYNQYHKMSLALGVDYLDDPDLLKEDYHAILCACWYWKATNLNKFADKDDLDAVSDIINIGRLTDRVGDANGFAERKEALKDFKNYFKA